MNELLEIFNLLKGPMGGVAAAALAAVAYLWTQRNQRQLAGADTASTIKAIVIYEKMVEEERAARALAEARADRFAEERNEAYKNLYELKGQLTEMARQLERQTTEMQGLRDQIRHLEERLSGKS